MPCYPKVVAVVLPVFLAGGLLFAQEQRKPAAPAYLLSVLVGFKRITDVVPVIDINTQPNSFGLGASLEYGVRRWCT